MKINTKFLAVFFLLPSLAWAQKINSCDAFVKAWLDKYEFAKTYQKYNCESTKLNSATFVIFGMPGLKSTDQWFYQPKTNTVLRLNPDTTWGRKAQTVYSLKDFSVLSSSDVQGNYAAELGKSPSPGANYCARSTNGGPPIGCGLTLADCNRVVTGLPGMFCSQ